MPVGERVLVAVGPSPGSERLLRAAHQLAGRLGCPWVAAYVALPRAPADAELARVEHHLRLAESLGAEVVRLAGGSLAGALVAYARANGVTRILVGRPGAPRWRDLLSGSVIDALVRAPLDVEVHVTVDAETPTRPAPTGVPAAHPRLLVAAAGFVTIATLVALLAARVTSSADTVMVYLLAVLVSAFRLGRAPALVSAALSVGAYNFFFVPPYHTFAVADTRNLLTFAVLFGVGVAASALADRNRVQEAEAVARERRTAALLSLTRATAAALDEPGVARAVVGEAAARIASGAALWVVARGSGADGEDELAPSGLTCIGRDGEVGDGCAGLAGRALASSGPLEGDHAIAYPIQVDGLVVGALVLRAPTPGTADLAEAWARQTALALARVRHASAAEHAAVRVRTEELRSALLSTVSHDLRTPLATITGAATTLLDADAPVSAEAGRELLTSIRDEAAHLERLVGNLLEMTRLSAGPVAIRREWVPLDEIVGSAFARVDNVLARHDVHVDLPADLPLVELDPVLFEHVVANLLENAARHTPRGTRIDVTASANAGGVRLVVADQGLGFPPGDPSRLFEPFVRAAAAGTPGSGLGLAICRGVVTAHGGTITAERRPGGGAAVVVQLPHRQAPPPIPPEPEDGR